MLTGNATLFSPSDVKSYDSKSDGKKPLSHVLVQKYQLEVIGDDACSYNIIEYFVPSEKIVFNKDAAFFSEEPRNISVTNEYFPKTFIESVVSLARISSKKNEAKKLFSEGFDSMCIDETVRHTQLARDNRDDAAKQGNKIAEAIAILKL